MPTIKVAIIVPTLDEEESIRRNLPLCLPLAEEVVVSDGGSRDRTVELAAELGAKIVTGPPGRGPQMNRGAAESRSQVLVFLHADSRLPPDGTEAIRRLVTGGRVGGGFLMRFDDRRARYRIGSALVNLRTRLSRAPLGDQGQFATREAFARLGGFEDWPILEDLDFIRRLKRLGPIAIVPRPVTTSARRYVAGGALATIANNWLIWSLFLLGASPHRLAQRYRKVR